MGKDPRTRRVFPQLLLALTACTGGPPTPAECDATTDVTQRDECYAEVAPDVFRKNPEEGDALVQKIQDVTVRDFVYLAVTREVDPGSARWCEKIRDSALASRCRVLVSRPHLHRELLRASGHDPSGEGPKGPGGPPPGGPGGPPPPGGPRHPPPPPGEGPPPRPEAP